MYGQFPVTVFLIKVSVLKAATQSSLWTSYSTPKDRTLEVGHFLPPEDTWVPSLPRQGWEQRDPLVYRRVLHQLAGLQRCKSPAPLGKAQYEQKILSASRNQDNVFLWSLPTAASHLICFSDHRCSLSSCLQ